MRKAIQNTIIDNVATMKVDALLIHREFAKCRAVGKNEVVVYVGHADEI